MHGGRPGPLKDFGQGYKNQNAYMQRAGGYGGSPAAAAGGYPGFGGAGGAGYCGGMPGMGGGCPDVQRETPSPKQIQEKQQEVEQKVTERVTEVLYHKDSFDASVSVTDGEMEFSFPQRNNISPLDVMKLLSDSPVAAPKPMIFINFVKDGEILTVRVADRKSSSLSYKTEVMIPTNKLTNGMLHSRSPYFSADEVDLCVELYKLYNSAEGKKAAGKWVGSGATKPAPKKKGGGGGGGGAMGAGGGQPSADKELEKDPSEMSIEEIKDGLIDLGIEVFMPPFQNPALDPENGCVDQEVSDNLWLKIAGYEQPKACCKQSVTLPLLRPDLFSRMAALARGVDEDGKTKGVTGVLMTGPPGVGKTSMAKVAAHSAGVPLVYVPVESIMSKWYGEAEQKLRSVFDLTRAFPRAVLFLDELDAFAGSRDGSMHEATRRILSVLLRQLDGLENDAQEKKQENESEKFLVMIGATNRPDQLDAALLSRFDQAIDFPLPKDWERAAIFGVYAGVLTEDQRNEIAAACDGYAGRDIVEVCNQAQRMHLFNILEDHTGNVVDMTVSGLTPPPVSVYLEAIKQRNAGNRFDAPGKH